MRMLSCVVVILGIAPAVYAQSDLERLRELFGGPATRHAGSPAVSSETYTARPGVGMVVDYGPSGNMCKLSIPDHQVSKEQIDAILNKAVPDSMRGKPWGELESYAGRVGSRSRYYEKVIITETIFTSKVTDKRPGASVTVKSPECGWKAGQDPFDRPPETK